MNTDTSILDQDLAGLIVECYPGMPASAAQSLAGSPAFQEVAGFMEAWGRLHASRHFNTDFVVVVVCGFILRIVNISNQIYSAKPIHRKALSQSAVHWVFPPEPIKGVEQQRSQE
jgi:hypothetical protein